MAHDPPPLISREAPRSRRRRRRSQQQSSCCCCSIVAFSLLAVLIAWRGPIFSVFHRSREQSEITAASFPLELQTDAPQYLRYSLIRLTARVTDAQGRLTTMSSAPEVVVRLDGEIITTVGDVERLKLRFDRATQTYYAYWPIPWNAKPGDYVAEASIVIPDPNPWVWETPEQCKKREEEEKRERRRGRKIMEEKLAGTTTCTARARFTINARPRAAIQPGTCIATWEPNFKPDGIPRPDGRLGDWRAMFDWCEYIGADTFWMRGAVTEVPRGLALTDEMPFNPYPIQPLAQVAAEAHHRGLRFGTWAAAYATYPLTNERKPKYRWAQDISRGTGAISDLDFISLLEPKRISHIAGFFSQMQALPNVDYLGLDYMRTDRGGYEMVDQFTSEMPVELPDGFQAWSQRKRWSYVAQKVERDWQKDPDFYDSWNWWRAHRGAENLQSIINTGQIKKPIWIFVLSWWHGKQHGQDPIMFNDGGASLLAPMLYQVPNRAHFDSMVEDWNEYLNAGQVNLAPGDQVDFKWHQRLLQPAAPEELYDRMVTAHRKYERGGLTVGCFWHDISRAAQWGNRGPYPGSEWALAGGAAFSTVRTNWQVYPLTATLDGPKNAAIGGTAQLNLTLNNIAHHAVKRIEITIEKTSGIEPVGGARFTRSVAAGETLTIPITVKLKGRNPGRANRFMVAVRATWPDEDYGKKFRRDLPRVLIAMKYVQGR